MNNAMTATDGVISSEELRKHWQGHCGFTGVHLYSLNKFSPNPLHSVIGQKPKMFIFGHEHVKIAKGAIAGSYFRSEVAVNS